MLHFVYWLDALVGYEDAAVELAFKETMDKAQQSLMYRNKNLKIEDFFNRVNSEDSYEVSTEGTEKYILELQRGIDILIQNLNIKSKSFSLQGHIIRKQSDIRNSISILVRVCDVTMQSAVDTQSPDTLGFPKNRHPDQPSRQGSHDLEPSSWSHYPQRGPAWPD